MKARQLFLAAAVLPLALAACSKPAASSTGTAAGAGTGAAATRTASAGGQGGAGAGAQGAPGRRFAAVSVQAITVKAGPLVTDNDTAGTVVPVTQSSVAAQVSGVVLKVLHRVGDVVKDGTPVIQLDDSALRLAVANAQASLDNATINLAMGQQTTSASNPRLADQLAAARVAQAGAQKTWDSQKALFDLGGISESQLDTASSALATAKANTEAAQAALDQNSTADTQNIAQLKLAVTQAQNQLAIAQLGTRNATITAPFTGQIAAINVTPGSYVSLNTAAFVLVSADKQINFTEPPTDAPSFRIGDQVVFNWNGKGYPGRLLQAPSAPINGVVPMVASVPASVPVAYGSVGTTTYRLTIATGPQIPISALQSRANTNFVYTVQNSKAAETPVTIINEAGTTAVVHGVNDGDQVVINPPPGLLNGSTVQVVAAAAAGQGSGQQGAATTGSGGGQRSGGTGSGQRSGGTSGTGTTTPSSTGGNS
jgi:HlyD family secretion protein